MTGLLPWQSESRVWRAECLVNNEIGVRGEKWIGVRGDVKLWEKRNQCERRKWNRRERWKISGLLSWQSESWVWRAECLANNGIGMRGEKSEIVRKTESVWAVKNGTGERGEKWDEKWNLYERWKMESLWEAKKGIGLRSEKWNRCERQKIESVREVKLESVWEMESVWEVKNGFGVKRWKIKSVRGVTKVRLCPPRRRHPPIILFLDLLH